MELFSSVIEIIGDIFLLCPKMPKTEIQSYLMP